MPSSTEKSSSTAAVMAKSFFMACSPLLRPYFFSAQPNFYSIRKVIPLYKNQPSVRYFSINAQNKQDSSCLFAMICNHFGESALFCLRWHPCAQALSGQLLSLLLRGACRPCRQRETGCCTKRAAARWSFLLFCQLFIQPCGDICKNLQLIGLQQQLVAGTGVEDAFNVQHTGVLQALDGAAHALPCSPTGSASPERKSSGRSLGIRARKAGSCRRRMPLNIL